MKTLERTMADAEPDTSENAESDVSAETSRRLCCDAGASVLSEDENGDTLNIGRKTRVIPPAMRRALIARDEDLFINANTCVTHYDGSPMDWNLAVGALFQ